MARKDVAEAKTEAEVLKEAEIERERITKTKALEATIKSCEICTYKFHYVDNYTSEERKDDPVLMPTNTHHVCEYARGLSLRVRRLEDIINGLTLYRSFSERARDHIIDARAVMRMRVRTALHHLAAKL